jgi:hypothetical protein
MGFCGQITASGIFSCMGLRFPEGDKPVIGDRISYQVGADRRPGREPRVCALNARIVVDKAPAGLFKAPTFGDQLDEEREQLAADYARDEQLEQKAKREITQ